MQLVLDEPTGRDEQYHIDGLDYLVDRNLARAQGLITVDFRDDGLFRSFVVSSEKIPLSSCG